jgi:maltose-binding protein MalE
MHMKKIIAIGAVVVCSLMLLSSCTKNSKDDLRPNTSLSPDKIISAKVSSGQTLTIPIDNAGELSIVRQAINHKISQTGIDPKNNSLIYSYAPADGFTGADEVLLAHKTTTGYSGSCNYGDAANMNSSRIAYITIKITVAN